MIQRPLSDAKTLSSRSGPVSVGRCRPGRLVACQGGERCIHCGDNVSFSELTRRIHLLAQDLDDAIALLEAATHQAVDLAQGFRAQGHRLLAAKVAPSPA